MKLLILLFLMLPFGLIAQLKNSPSPSGSPIYTFVDQQPYYPGGDKQLNKFIRKHVNYTIEARKAKITGLVVVQFVVDIDGSLSDIEVVKKLGYGLDEEAVRVTNMFPKFIPALQKDKPVAFRYTLPFRFGRQ